MVERCQFCTLPKDGMINHDDCEADLRELQIIANVGKDRKTKSKR